MPNVRQDSTKWNEEGVELSAIDPRTGRSYDFMCNVDWGIWYTMDYDRDDISFDEIDLISCQVFILQSIIDTGRVQIGLGEVISDNYVPPSRAGNVSTGGEYEGLGDDDVFSHDEYIEVKPRREQLVAIEKKGPDLGRVYDFVV